MKRIFFALLLAVPAAVQSPAARAQDAEKWKEEVLFKGRLVAVTFHGGRPLHAGPTKDVTTGYQFVVLKPYTKACLGHAGSLFELSSDGKVDVASLTQENYDQKIQGLLPQGVRLGDEVLVEGSWVGMERSIVRTSPCTLDTEKDFVIRHKDTIAADRQFREDSLRKTADDTKKAFTYYIQLHEEYLKTAKDEDKKAEFRKAIEGYRKEMKDKLAWCEKELRALDNDQPPAEDAARKNPDTPKEGFIKAPLRIVFKAKLLTVGFQGTAASRRVCYEFLPLEPYGEDPIFPQEGTLTLLATEKAFDVGTLTADNYRARIQEALPKGISPGQTVLVEADSKLMFGFERPEVHAYTAEAERTLREKHRKDVEAFEKKVDELKRKDAK